MDLIAILSTVILVVTIGTITVAVAAYAALKLRDRRKPKKGQLQAAEGSTSFEPVFLKRYMPPSRLTPSVADAPSVPAAAAPTPTASAPTDTTADPTGVPSSPSAPA